MYPSFIPNNIQSLADRKSASSSSSAHTMSDIQFVFAHFSLYILFPLLYIIISTGNIAPIMIVWNYIQSGIFNTSSYIKHYLTDVVYATLRLFGQYTFSTYTVVRNGREIYTSSSMCYFRQSDVKSVYHIDRAKYNVCKWIDKQCAIYSRQHNGDIPELTETHNDIYDFILHKIDNEPYTRIHRGDFSGRTHTLSTSHYRKYHKSYEIAGTAEVMVCVPSSSITNGAETETETAPEIFTINLKAPHHFFLEKNEFLDKKFLQWKLYNECGRPDVAEYIGLPFSKYKVAVCYSECMKNRNSVAYQLNDSHSILIGNKHIIKVDSVLRCPVLECNEREVFDIDGILTSYYDCSDTADDSDETDAETDAETETETDADAETETDAETDADAETETDATTDHDPEFEIIEELAN